MAIITSNVQSTTKIEEFIRALRRPSHPRNIKSFSGGSRICPRRGRQLPGGGAPTYDFAKISQKLHEIERIWTPRGRASLTLPLRSATVIGRFIGASEFKFFHFMQFSAKSLQNYPTLGAGPTSGKFLIIHCYSLCQNRILCVLDFPLEHGRGFLSNGSLPREGGLCPGGLCPGGLCPGGSLSRGGLYPGGLCPGGSLSREGGSLSRGFLSWGISVQGRGVSVQGGLCPGKGGLCPGKGGLCPGGFCPGGSLSTTGMHSFLAKTFRNLHENLTGFGGMSTFLLRRSPTTSERGSVLKNGRVP